jgi:hypothetical protein
MEWWGGMYKRGDAAGLCCSPVATVDGRLPGGEPPPLLKTAMPFMEAMSHRIGGCQVIYDIRYTIYECRRNREGGEGRTRRGVKKCVKSTELGVFWGCSDMK